ncbi:MAG: 30S ribosomal protein S19e [Nanoarchaeota archaeon]|nr:30S ribosomal protein S19e [Nanoarchaeota archaeon]
MVTVYDVDAGKLIDKAAVKIAGMIKMPEWAKYVKTGVNKERPPEDLDWWYKRAVAILRTVYLQGPIGTNSLRVKYGSKKHRGARPEKFRKGSGKVIRTILQQLEQVGLINQTEKGVHKGRAITATGKSFLDKLSKEVK